MFFFEHIFNLKYACYKFKYFFYDFCQNSNFAWSANNIRTSNGEVQLLGHDALDDFVTYVAGGINAGTLPDHDNAAAITT